MQVDAGRFCVQAAPAPEAPKHPIQPQQLHASLQYASARLGNPSSSEKLPTGILLPSKCVAGDKLCSALWRVADTALAAEALRCAVYNASGSRA